ncbi:MAG: nuclear transport factor 2 family protein [Bacteroidia bacterium]|nr:nuclear transport factor 2 family protein [Bacteroidia bacterium]
MKGILLLLLLFTVVSANAQTEEDKLIKTMKEFHQALVQKNTVSINQQTEKSLSYGHSSGWVQTKNDIINDFESGLISYQSFKEDSIQVFMSDNLANVRFNADIDATLKGNNSTIHLKVLEVWVKKGKRWLLFGRQAVR